MPGNWGLIDLDTPKDAYTMPSWRDPSKMMRLVFSDEFNTEGSLSDSRLWSQRNKIIIQAEPSTLETIHTGKQSISIIGYETFFAMFPKLNGFRKLTTWNGMIPQPLRQPTDRW